MAVKTLEDLVVLLVEPSTPQAKYIVRQLQEAGIVSFEVVKNGEQALENMRILPPDLVISAMYLPDMTSNELIHQIRHDEHLCRIAFMLISSETSFSSLDPIRQAGVTAILPKPFDHMQLKRALYNTLDYLDPGALHLEEFSVDELRVLIVDDSNMARRHIKRVLSGMGIEHFTEATDGAEAIPLLEQNFFDLIVTDFNMPEMDGKALVEFVRNRSNQRSVPVLMVTSEGDQGMLSAVEQAGVSAICDKPFESNTVRAMIEMMMSGV